MIKLVSDPSRVKNLALTITIIVLASIFLFVRKRQLIKRVLLAAYRLFTRLTGNRS